MSKTAEEILNSYLGDVNKTLFRNCVEPAMHEFAAQEVDDYKKSLREEVEFLNKTRQSWLLNRVLELIDTVK